MLSSKLDTKSELLYKTSVTGSQKFISPGGCPMHKSTCGRKVSTLDLDGKLNLRKGSF
tara:strand:+ start:597 stop:770 length:174 start_codon:yes stop_codon:yes gene_type:complete